MTDPRPQTFESHARYVPLYHFVTAGIILLYVVWSGYRFVVERSMDRFMAVLVGVALLLLFYYARAFALAVQDRVIRVEERLRLRALCPPGLHPAIEQLTRGQLIALRFASDEEAADLARQVIEQNIHSRHQIKSMIRQWRGDHYRA